MRSGVVRAAPLGVSALLTGVGVALSRVPGLLVTQGWLVALAAVGLGLLTVTAVRVRSRALGWLALIPIGIGVPALGNWLFNVAGCWLLNLPAGVGFPAGAGVSLVGMVLAIPGAAVLHRGRAPGRLAIIAAALAITVVALAAGVVRGPEYVCRTLI